MNTKLSTEQRKCHCFTWTLSNNCSPWQLKGKEKFLKRAIGEVIIVNLKVSGSVGWNHALALTGPRHNALPWRFKVIRASQWPFLPLRPRRERNPCSKWKNGKVHRTPYWNCFAVTKTLHITRKYLRAAIVNSTPKERNNFS